MSWTDQNQDYTPFVCMMTCEPTDNREWRVILSTIALAWHCRRALKGWREKPYFGWPCNELATFAMTHFHTSVTYSPRGLFPVYFRESEG